MVQNVAEVFEIVLFLIKQFLVFHNELFYFLISKMNSSTYTNSEKGSNSVYREIFALFYFRPFRPHCQKTNLRLGELYYTNNFSVYTTTSGRIHDRANRLQL